LDCKDNNRYNIFFVFNENDMLRSYPIISSVLKLYPKKDKIERHGKVYTVHKMNWWYILQDFGNMTNDKKVPNWVHSAPRWAIEKFLEGYLHANGNVDEKGFHYTTTSADLAFSVQRLYLKLEVFTDVQFQHRPLTFVIEGRTLNQRNLLSTNERDGERNMAFFSDGYAWFKVKEVTQVDIINTNVYNFDVKDDNSYIVENLSVHNCHMFCQFYVTNSELSCLMYQRSGDTGLGIPFNIASYALLTYMIAHICDLKPGDFIHTIGDAHIYNNHVEELKTQLNRVPRPFPKLNIKRKVTSIDDFKFADFDLVGYDPYPNIVMKMAV